MLVVTQGVYLDTLLPSTCFVSTISIEDKWAQKSKPHCHSHPPFAAPSVACWKGWPKLQLIHGGFVISVAGSGCADISRDISKEPIYHLYSTPLRSKKIHPRA